MLLLSLQWPQLVQVGKLSSALNVLSTSKLASASSQGKVRGARKGKIKHKLFLGSTCVTLSNISLRKAKNVAVPRSSFGQNAPPTMGRAKGNIGGAKNREHFYKSITMLGIKFICITEHPRLIDPFPLKLLWYLSTLFLILTPIASYKAFIVLTQSKHT